MEIQQAINDICEELENSSINKQRKRYLQTYLSDLVQYQKNNPDSVYCPNNFELYCNLNPDSPECRIFDD